MELFDKPLWLKGNLHTHTTVSDGRCTPEEVIALYKGKGYDFLAITDHRRSVAREDPDMTLLTGVEYDYELPSEVIHIVGVGLERASSPEEDRAALSSPQAGLEVIAALKGRAILAHPAWSLNGPDTIASLVGIAAAEVYNTVSNPPWNGERGDSSGILDVAAARGFPVPLVASDDAHHYDGDACQSWIWLNAADASRESILEALDAGRFYASRGPRFTRIAWDGGTLRVECTPVERIVFYSDLPWVDGRVQTGAGLTTAAYRARFEEHFLRCQITDRAGNSAWMSPLDLR